MNPLLQVKDFHFYFHTREGIVRAVRGISFDLKKGETIGIVGESGCGKSCSMLALLGLLPTPPGKLETGHAFFRGKDLFQMPSHHLRQIRGKQISMIFQDPMTALNPYLRIETQVMEPLMIHENISKKEARKRALAALEEVGISDPKKRLRSFPHEFSGGMRQRVMIAMALITKPSILIADEPTTALDVTVQAQILTLIEKLQKAHQMSVIFITHNLGVIAGIADRVFVMYAGEFVEKGPCEKIFSSPTHPYTKALFEAIPSTHAPGELLETILGLPPDLKSLAPGCAFAPRCSFFKAGICDQAHPPLQTSFPGQESRCLRFHEHILEPSPCLSPHQKDLCS